MKVLVINSGSSSLKYQLIETDDGSLLCKGCFERINEQGSFFEHQVLGGELITRELDLPNHSVAVSRLFDNLIDPKIGAVKSLKEIEAIGHRVVHGGEVFSGSVIANAENITEVEKLSHLAPLHNPANIAGVKECVKRFAGVPNVMVFDTAFHSTMPKSAFLYGLPLEDYTQHKIRRYGFHGTSHNYVARKAAEMAGKNIKDLKIITCHIGNGGSIAAIDGGKSVETSMGVTPLEGLIMGTRSGDIDPAIVELLCKNRNMSVSDCIKYLNKKSGILGLTNGVTNDMRDLMKIRTSNPNAQTAVDCFIHRITKYIGAYIAVMNGVDIIVWTGGVGNNDEYVRRHVMKNFAYIGANIDHEKNDKLNGTPGYKNTTMDITAKGSKVKIYVICTNEELEIATETENLVNK